MVYGQNHLHLSWKFSNKYLKRKLLEFVCEQIYVYIYKNPFYFKHVAKEPDLLNIILHQY